MTPHLYNAIPLFSELNFQPKKILGCWCPDKRVSLWIRHVKVPLKMEGYFKLRPQFFIANMMVSSLLLYIKRFKFPQVPRQNITGNKFLGFGFHRTFEVSKFRRLHFQQLFFREIFKWLFLILPNWCNFKKAWWN